MPAALPNSKSITSEEKLVRFRVEGLGFRVYMDVPVEGLLLWLREVVVMFVFVLLW